MLGKVLHKRFVLRNLWNSDHLISGSSRRRAHHVTREACLSTASSNPASAGTRRKNQQLSVREQALLDQCGSEPFQLDTWRQQQRDHRWYWSNTGATEETTNPYLDAFKTDEPITLAEGCCQVLQTADLAHKCAVTHSMWRALVEEQLPVGSASPPEAPARPLLPKIVAPREVPKAKESGLPLNVYMLLNLAHVELNAIDLACDTVARFSGLGLPRDFYVDFAHVADDESRHLGWCLQRLGELGYSYGDMVVHGMLWEGAVVSSRPCSQEARGLDAGPRLVERLMSVGDFTSAAIVHQISKEEMAHVAVGTHWFRQLCRALSLEADVTFQTCLQTLCPDMLSGNHNHTARLHAGLQQNWYDKQLWVGTDTDSGRLVQDIAWQGLSSSQLSLLKTRLEDMLSTESSLASSTA